MTALNEEVRALLRRAVDGDKTALAEIADRLGRGDRRKGLEEIIHLFEEELS